MQQLLDDAQREVVADVVNAALLASATGKPKWEVKPQVRHTHTHCHIFTVLAIVSCAGRPDSTCIPTDNSSLAEQLASCSLPSAVHRNS